MKKRFLLILLLMSGMSSFAQTIWTPTYRTAGYQNVYDDYYLPFGWDYQIEEPDTNLPHTNYCDLWLDNITFRRSVVLKKKVITDPAQINTCNVDEGMPEAVGNNYYLGANVRFVNMGGEDMFMSPSNPTCLQPGQNSFMYYDRCHNHYHIENFMQFYVKDRCGNLLYSSPKLGWGFVPATNYPWYYQNNNGNPSYSRYYFLDSLTWQSLTRNETIIPDSTVLGPLTQDANSNYRRDAQGNLIYEGTKYVSNGGRYQLVDAGFADVYYADTYGNGVFISDSLARTLSSDYYLFGTIITPPPCVDQGQNYFSDTAETWIYLDWNLIDTLPLDPWTNTGEYNPSVLPYGTTPLSSVPSTPTVTVTQPTCSVPLGTIVITSPLGNDIEYSVNGIDWYKSTSFGGLAAGTYSVYARYGPNCVSSVTSVIINTANFVNTCASTITQPTCSTTTGKIVVTYPIGALTYSIDGVNYQSSTTFSNLAAGTYSLTAKNTAGCTSNPVSCVINASPSITTAPVATVTQPTCIVSTGTILVTSPTGAGLTYSIDGVSYQSSTTFDSLNAGIYSLTAKNASNCISPINSIVINQASIALLPPAISIRQPECDSLTGTVTILSPLGANYTYSIDGNTYQSSAIFTGLDSGSYNVTVEENGCISDPAVASIDTPLTIGSVTVSLTQPDCINPTGTIEVTSPLNGSGTQPYGYYEYSIDGTTYQVSNIFSNVNPGTYSVYARRQLYPSCVELTTASLVTVFVRPATPMGTVTQPSCSSPTGTIVVTSPTGTGYTYSINGTTYQSSPTFTGVAAGTYDVTTKLNGGCASFPYTVTLTAYTPGTPSAPTNVLASPSSTVRTATNPIILSFTTAGCCNWQAVEQVQVSNNLWVNTSYGIGSACSASVSYSMPVPTLSSAALATLAARGITNPRNFKIRFAVTVNNGVGFTSTTVYSNSINIR